MSSQSSVDVTSVPRPRLNRREANGLLLMGLGVAIAGLGQFYLSNRISLLDGLICFAIASFLFLKGNDALEQDNSLSLWELVLRPLEGRAGVRAVQPKYIAILIVIFIIALALRFYNLSFIPYGLWYDEAATGLEAARVGSDSGYRPTYSSGTTSPPAYLYVVAVFQEIFGQNIAVLRSVSALFGALTVIPFYVLGSLMYGPAAGLLGAFLIAASRWDINFSRMAMQGVTTPFFTTLVIALLLLAMRTKNIYLYLVAGACLGLGMWFYSSFLLFPVVVAAYLLWSARDPSHTGPVSWRGVAALVLATLLVAAPVFSFAATDPERFFSRITTASALKEQDAKTQLLTIWESTRKHILMFNYQGDRNGRHNIPGEPMVDPFSGMLAVLGFSYAVAKIRGPNSLLLLAWLGVMMAPGILSLSFEAPQGLRAIGTLPAVYLLALLAVGVLMKAYSRVLELKYMLYGVVMLAAVVGVTDIGQYFVVQSNNPASWAAFSTAETIIARRMVDLPAEDYDVGVSPLYHGNPAMRYIAGDRSYSIFDLSDGLPILPTSKDTVVFLAPEERIVKELINRYYPESTCDEITSPQGGPALLLECLVKQEHVLDTLGLSVKYIRMEDNTALLTAKEPALEIRPGDGLYRKEWSGSLYVPEYGEYGLAYTGSPSLELLIDGNKVLGPDDNNVKLSLAKGLHNIYATAIVTGPGSMEVKWQREGGDPEALPQEYLFGGNVQANGLVGRYYSNPYWQGPPALERIDPALSLYFHILPLERPYSVEWKGSIYAEEGGIYKLGLRSIGPSQLYLDGRLIVEAALDDRVTEGVVPLASGWRQLLVRFQDVRPYSSIYLYWAPPDRGMEIVPPWYLRPW